MRRKLALTAVLTVALAVAGYAQKPDFSGTWTPDADATGTAVVVAAARGMAGPLTVKQSGDTLTVERQGRNGQMTTAYKLDGSESEITMGQMTAKATAKWDGSKLVITTKSGQGEATQTWSLDGGMLTIERTGGRGTGKTTYKKDDVVDGRTSTVRNSRRAEAIVFSPFCLSVRPAVAAVSRAAPPSCPSPDRAVRGNRGQRFEDELPVPESRVRDPHLRIIHYIVARENQIEIEHARRARIWARAAGGALDRHQVGQQLARRCIGQPTPTALRYGGSCSRPGRPGASQFRGESVKSERDAADVGGRRNDGAVSIAEIAAERNRDYSTHRVGRLPRLSRRRLRVCPADPAGPRAPDRRSVSAPGSRRESRAA